MQVCGQIFKGPKLFPIFFLQESEQESILKYFSEVGDDCFSDDDLTDEPQAKRMKTW